MRFNTRHIDSGDSKDQIISKANSNFDQIFSFGIGPNGLRGPVGPTGYPGSSGLKGATGLTGQRHSDFYKTGIQPTGSQLSEYDSWINFSATGSNAISQYLSGSWTPTGVSLYGDDFFETENSIPGYVPTSEFNAIYFSGSSQPDEYLVISDFDLDATRVNPNYSKLLITTRDQTANPIFEFRKVNGPTSGQPAFYWDQSGNNSGIKLNTEFPMLFSANGSYGAIGITGATGNVSFSSNNFSISSSRSIYIGSTAGSGSRSFSSVSNILFSTNNFTVTPSSIVLNHTSGGFSVEGSVTVTPSASIQQDNILVIQKNLTIPTSGNPVGGPLMDVRSSTGGFNYSILSVGATSDSMGSTKFGSTGGYAKGMTGPSGPFSYHVRKTNYITPNFISISTTNLGTVPCLDLSSTSYFDKNVIVFGGTGSTASAGATSDFYVILPGNPSSVNVPSTENLPVWNTGDVSEYKLLFDGGSGISASSLKIRGVLVHQLYKQYSTSPVTRRYVGYRFNNSCNFIDVVYQPPSVNSDNQVVAFVKNCFGQGIQVQVTNVSATPRPIQVSSQTQRPSTATE